MIIKCTCKHQEQDKLHGTGMRVATVAHDGTPRCTVCGPIARDQERLRLHAAQHIQKIHG